ncbi:hypothetical protein N4P33_34280, partial [Streptomyces sp. 15-116A]|nr:hypothetical protein [Streptomyces sp. 15-116A]
MDAGRPSAASNPARVDPSNPASSAGGAAGAVALTRAGYASIGALPPPRTGSTATPGAGATNDGTTTTKGTGRAIVNRLSTRNVPSA